MSVTCNPSKEIILSCTNKIDLSFSFIYRHIYVFLRPANSDTGNDFFFFKFKMSPEKNHI